ncbi:MAG: PepSY domain-containing protein [Hyphomicrobiaceae bacterium]|nr:PepSY domain-containing protein [Hyphomicrobiaceae bacterium]
MGFGEFRIGIPVALCCALLAVSHAASAKDDDNRRGRDRDRIERAYEGREAGDLKPVSELIDIVVAALGGTVVEIEFEDEDGGAMYEFYLLGKDGRIREVYVDGRSGEILSAKPDD